MRSAFGQRCARAWRDHQDVALAFSECVFERRAAASSGTTRIYVVFDSNVDAVKIGKSSNPAARFGNIQVANAHGLSLEVNVPGSDGIEKIAHSFLDADRIRGEWFRCTHWTLVVCELLYALGDWENVDPDLVVDAGFAAAVLYDRAEDLRVSRGLRPEAVSAIRGAEAS